METNFVTWFGIGLTGLGSVLCYIGSSKILDKWLNRK